MSAHVQIRRAIPRDFGALGHVFHAAVREGATLYSEAQRTAWSPAPRGGEDWTAHLAGQSVWLAEDGSGSPLGFLTLRPDGYVDLAYIRAKAQGRGLFRRLYNELEAEARRLALPRLWTDASLHARGPFEGAGFIVTAPETVMRNGEAFKRFRMEKILNG
ncbi:MAG: GNAT family N-acetyltransferase [Hyphomonas sp.]